jgi:predicted component of type VI protein secretion system
MVTCPTCQYANPDAAERCERCGKPVAGGPTSEPAAPTTVNSVGRVTTADSPLSTPLPAPMVEPILTPTAPPTDGEPPSSHPALTRSLRVTGGDGSGDGPRAPAPETKCDYSAPLGTGAPVTVRTNNGSTATVSPTPVAGVAGVAAPTPLPIPVDSPSAPPARLKLVVLRGQKVAAEYPIYEGRNTIGRFVDKPVDIDLVTQEPVEQVWCSRLHAAITFDRGIAFVEDLNSLNGTWVNGARIHPGQSRQVKPNDVLQVGTVQMKLVAG